MKLDLDTLKYIKFLFDLQSDQSIHCNGYRTLKEVIEEQEEKSKLVKESNAELWQDVFYFIATAILCIVYTMLINSNLK